MKVFIAGHNGMVGSAIHNAYLNDPDVEILVADRKELDLEDNRAVGEFLQQTKPDQIILAAAFVGGIAANSSRQAEFLLKNLQIQNNVISQAHLHDVGQILFLSSSCVYPKHSALPIRENQLLESRFEETNEGYALAKAVGLKMCHFYSMEFGRDYRAVMPSNIYGPNDNFHPFNSHVLPALIRKVHHAKSALLPSITIWGSGKPKREFLHCDDLAAGCRMVAQLPKEQWTELAGSERAYINIGSSHEISIIALTKMICDIVGFRGAISTDTSMPDGVDSKILDSMKIRSLGWSDQIPLRQGIAQTYEYFHDNIGTVRSQ